MRDHHRAAGANQLIEMTSRGPLKFNVKLEGTLTISPIGEFRFQFESPSGEEAPTDEKGCPAVGVEASIFDRRSNEDAACQPNDTLSGDKVRILGGQEDHGPQDRLRSDLERWMLRSLSI